MRCAKANVVHLSAIVLGVAGFVECAPSGMQFKNSAPVPLSKAVEDLEDDGIEAAADSLARLSAHAPALPDLPEHLDYLVRDTEDGPQIAVASKGLVEFLQEHPEATMRQQTNLDVDVILAEQENEKDASVNSQKIVDLIEDASVNSQKVVDLNRFNFHNSVLQDGHDQPVHWIIRFCHDWYVPCEHLTSVFTETALGIESRLNANDQFQTTVRFADVDCSTNKPLCNEVADYHFPQIIHFHGQARYSDWKGGGNLNSNTESFLRWMDKQAQRIETMVEFPTQLESKVRKESKGDPMKWELRHLIAVFVTIAGALAGYFWFLVRTLTGIGVCAQLPSTMSMTSSQGSPSCRRQLTCRDMLPDDWRPNPANGATIDL
jgi:hypothetical protein